MNVKENCDFQPKSPLNGYPSVVGGTTGGTLLKHLIEPIASHLKIPSSAVHIEAIRHGTQQKQNVCRLRIDTESYLLKQHDITTSVVEAGYTPFQIESTVLSLLHRNRCHVPKIIWKSERFHALLLEWCGELTLDAMAQSKPIPELKPVLHTVLMELCRVETVFAEHARQFEPYVFHFNLDATLQRLLEQGRKTLGYLAHFQGASMTSSQAAHLDTAWDVISNRLRTTPPTLDSLDYQGRNIMITERTPCFIDFASVGWDWQERRLAQYFNSIGANQEDANFISLLNRDLVDTYAAWVITHREACSPADIAARVDAHHLLFYLSVVHRLLQAVAQPEAPKNRILLQAWGDAQARFQRAITLIVNTHLSDDVYTTRIREILSAFHVHVL